MRAWLQSSKTANDEIWPSKSIAHASLMERESPTRWEQKKIKEMSCEKIKN